MASERIVNGYARLFELHLLHHYWLDEGATVFDVMTDAGRQRLLLGYDVRKMLELRPTPTTVRVLEGIRAVFRATALGGVVAVPKDTVIPDDMTFEFTLVVRGFDFFNYTALTTATQAVHGLFHPPSKSTIRFKENVAVFSNLTGVSRGVGPNRKLYLSREIPALGAQDKVEAIVNVGGALVQLTGDQPGAGQQQIAAVVTNAPVYAHQGDVRSIVPPADIVGTPPAKGITLSDDIGADTYAVVRITAVRAGDADYSCTSGGLPKAAHPVFQIRFKNRSTTWRTFSRTDPAILIQEAGPFPLTHTGNATTTQKPSTGIVTFEKSGNAISKIVSNVYV